jgi:hypothetical protein
VLLSRKHKLLPCHVELSGHSCHATQQEHHSSSSISQLHVLLLLLLLLLLVSATTMIQAAWCRPQALKMMREISCNQNLMPDRHLFTP